MEKELRLEQAKWRERRKVLRAIEDADKEEKRAAKKEENERKKRVARAEQDSGANWQSEYIKMPFRSSQ